MTIGLFAALLVLRTKTALVAGGAVVAGAVEVVASGAGVVSVQGKSSHGHPPGQLSWRKIKYPAASTRKSTSHGQSY